MCAVYRVSSMEGGVMWLLGMGWRGEKGKERGEGEGEGDDWGKGVGRGWEGAT